MRECVCVCVCARAPPTARKTRGERKAGDLLTLSSQATGKMAEPGPLGPGVLEAAVAGTALCCSEQRPASTRLSLALPLRPHFPLFGNMDPATLFTAMPGAPLAPLPAGHPQMMVTPCLGPRGPDSEPLSGPFPLRPPSPGGRKGAGGAGDILHFRKQRPVLGGQGFLSLCRGSVTD